MMLIDKFLTKRNLEQKIKKTRGIIIQSPKCHKLYNTSALHCRRFSIPGNTIN